MAKKKEVTQLTMFQVINKWTINQRIIAKKLKMPLPTFRSRLYQYIELNDKDSKRLLSVLHDLSNDIVKRNLTIQKFINKWKIRMPLLSEGIGMPIGTFKSNFYLISPGNKFSEDQTKKIWDFLNHIAIDIQNIKQ